MGTTRTPHRLTVAMRTPETGQRWCGLQLDDTAMPFWRVRLRRRIVVRCCRSVAPEAQHVGTHPVELRPSRFTRRTVSPMDTADAAHQWALVWERAWPAKDVDAIVALYAADVLYRALAFREPDRGLDGVRSYLQRNVEVEDDIECRFGKPVAADDRAAVEWWASWMEDGEQLTLAGVTILRFDGGGLVVDHRDYWNQVDRRQGPFSGW